MFVMEACASLQEVYLNTTLFLVHTSRSVVPLAQPTRLESLCSPQPDRSILKLLISDHFNRFLDKDTSHEADRSLS